MERLTIEEKVIQIKNSLSELCIGDEMSCTGVYDDQLCPQPGYKEIDCNGCDSLFEVIVEDLARHAKEPGRIQKRGRA
jgi:hypothetical protein